MESLHRQTLDCVHCGLCLPTCPTYIETGNETSSPRGRIYLMRAVAEGRASLEGLVAEEAFLCLGCRACETACPSGVEYGSLLEQTRAAVDRAGLRADRGARLERILLRDVVPRPQRLHRLVGLLGWLQWTRLDRLGLALLALAPGLSARARQLRKAHSLMPRIPGAAERAPLALRTPAEGERRGEVAFFVGCLMPEIFGEVNRATVRVLARNGFDVVVPPEQGCCGALLAHGGDLDSASDLARHNAGVFTASETVVVNSAGCGAALRDAGHWIGADGRGLAARVRDIAEFLDGVGLRAPEGRFAARVCYDDPCHLVHAQRVADAPRRLLAAIPGLELVPHAEAGACCGAAGIYNLTHPEMSQAVLDRKLDALEAADPDVVTSGNPGCLMQLRAGLAARGHRAEVLHPVELLDRVYRGV